MLTTEIIDRLKNIKTFLGVYPRDLLPDISKYKKPVGLIVNTDDSNNPGKHWIAIIVDKNGHGEYFDSMGILPYFDEFNTFLNKYCYNGILYNNITLQCSTCITCGEYCVAFIINRLKLKRSFLSYINLFSCDLNYNDLIIKNLYSIL